MIIPQCCCASREAVVCSKVVPAEMTLSLHQVLNAVEMLWSFTATVWPHSGFGSDWSVAGGGEERPPDAGDTQTSMGIERRSGRDCLPLSSCSGEQITLQHSQHRLKHCDNCFPTHTDDTKAKLSAGVPKHHAMTAYSWWGGKAPHIHIVGTRCKVSGQLRASATLRPVPLDRRLGGHQSRSRQTGSTAPVNHFADRTAPTCDETEI